MRRADAWGGLVAVALGACARTSNAPPPPPVVVPLAAASASAPPESADVVSLYERACTGNSAVGCNNLGLVFLEGRHGKKRDAPRAAALFQRACDLGLAMGCGNLGFLEHAGNGVARNDAKAVGLLTRACDAGVLDMCYWLGDVFFGGEQEDLAHAFEVFEAACKKGHARSCAGQGVMLQTGKGVAKDGARAVMLLEKGCGASVAFACSSLGALFLDGDGVRVDVDRARADYEKGCTDDYPRGCYAYAVACASGKLGDEYVSRTDSLLKRACDAGHADSCTVLAQRLEKQDDR